MISAWMREMLESGIWTSFSAARPMRVRSPSSYRTPTLGPRIISNEDMWGSQRRGAGHVKVCDYRGDSMPDCRKLRGSSRFAGRTFQPHSTATPGQTQDALAMIPYGYAPARSGYSLQR